MSVLYCHSILQKYKKNLTFQKKELLFTTDMQQSPLLCFANSTRIYTDSLTACINYKKASMSPSQKQHRSSLSTRAPKSVYTKRSFLTRPQDLTRSEASLHEPLASYTCEAPYTPAGPYTKRNFLTRAAGSLLVRSTLKPHSAQLALRAEAFAIAVVA